MNLPEQVNQTLIATLIGGVGIYYFNKLGFDSYIDIFIFFFLLLYTLYMAVLSCLQMYKNTRRYWIKEILDKNRSSV